MSKTPCNHHYQSPPQPSLGMISMINCVNVFHLVTLPMVAVERDIKDKGGKDSYALGNDRNCLDIVICRWPTCFLLVLRLMGLQRWLEMQESLSSHPSTVIDTTSMVKVTRGDRLCITTSVIPSIVFWQCSWYVTKQQGRGWSNYCRHFILKVMMMFTWH